jgi:hypothetical protein
MKKDEFTAFVDKAFDYADKNKDGSISLEEFKGMTRKIADSFLFFSVLDWNWYWNWNWYCN